MSNFNKESTFYALLVTFVFIGGIILGISISRNYAMHPDINAIDSTFCGNEYCKKLLDQYIKQHSEE